MSISAYLHKLLEDWLQGGGNAVLVNPVGSNTYIPSIPYVALSVIYDETSALEQDATGATIADRSKIGAIWLDMINVTQQTTIRIYHKIDSTNYRLFQENVWLVTDDPGVLIDGFIVYSDIKITLQCGGGGAGNVAVPSLVL